MLFLHGKIASSIKMKEYGSIESSQAGLEGGLLYLEGTGVTSVEMEQFKLKYIETSKSGAVVSVLTTASSSFVLNYITVV